MPNRTSQPTIVEDLNAIRNNIEKMLGTGELLHTNKVKNILVDVDDLSSDLINLYVNGDDPTWPNEYYRKLVHIVKMAEKWGALPDKLGAIKCQKHLIELTL